MAHPGPPGTTFWHLEQTSTRFRVRRMRSNYIAAPNMPEARPKGWLNNTKLNKHLKRNARMARLKGERLRGPKHTGLAHLGAVPSDKQLQKYLNDLRKERRRHNESGPQVVYQTAPEDRPPQGADPVRPERPELPPAQLQDKWEAIRVQLLSALKMVFEGLRNAHKTDTSTEHAIKDEIEGLETENFKLMPHQKDGIGRCLYLIENFGAFLLADDMGLGKTVEVIGIILLLRQKLREDPQYSHKPFLIVVPPSLIATWLEEFQSKTPSIKVLRFGAQGATHSVKDLTEVDVVLSSYGPVENMFARMATNQIHFKSIREGFDNELMESLHARYRRKQQQPRGRQAGGKEPELITDWCHEPLASIEWAGVILDEAHNIKNDATNRAQMMCLFKTKVRGALTGTPVQNGFLDFHSLLRFLRIPPFDNPQLFRACFLGKKTSGKRRPDTRLLAILNDAILSAVRSCITVRRLKDQTFDGEPILQLPPWEEFNYEVELSPDARAYQETTREIWDLKRRREAADARALARATSNTQGSGRAPDPEILANILRAKIHLIHPELINARYGEFGLEDLDNAKVGDAIAYEVNLPEVLPDQRAQETPLADKTTAARRFERVLSENEQRLRDKRREVFLRRLKRKKRAWVSDRTYHIVELVKRLIDRRKQVAETMGNEREKKEYLATHKILVFSEYLSALDVIDIGINEETGIQALRFDGTCSNQERVQNRHCFEEMINEAPKDFSKDDVHPHHVPVMLVSNKAGAEGITLVHASDVIHVGKIWNPHSEDQCITRASRKGREGDVNVHRFSSYDSIDRRVMQIHKNKRNKVSRIVNDQYLRQWGKWIESWELNDDVYLQAVGQTRIMSALKRGSLQVEVD
ncbi:hypothetical protein KC334_g269 [Hortaea werneckii]|nr:hypothetical protein KC334_g269 [Hortaea werneckii]